MNQRATPWIFINQGECRTGDIVFGRDLEAACQALHQGGLAAAEVSGEGKIWSIICPHPPLIAQFSAFAPYNAILVELIEDPRIRLIGNLVAAVDQPINSVSLDRAVIGDRVRVVFQDEADDWVMPRWELC